MAAEDDSTNYTMQVTNIVARCLYSCCTSLRSVSSIFTLTLERHSDEMLPVLVLTVFLGTISHSIAFDYTSTIMSESLTLFDSPLFSVDITGSGNDSVMYLRISRPITSTDQLYLEVVAERFDGMKFPIPNDPTPFCDILEEEAINEDTVLSKLRLSRVFNMEGIRCPVPSGKRRLMPYMFPPHITLHNDIGCGLFTYKIILQRSKKNEPKDYTPIISTETVIDLQTDNCSNVLT